MLYLFRVALILFSFLDVSYASPASQSSSFKVSTDTESIPRHEAHSSGHSVPVDGPACLLQSSPTPTQCDEGWYPFSYEKKGQTLWTCCTNGDDSSSISHKNIQRPQNIKHESFSYRPKRPHNHQVQFDTLLREDGIKTNSGNRILPIKDAARKHDLERLADYPIGFCFKLRMPTPVPCGDGWTSKNAGTNTAPLWTCCKTSEPTTPPPAPAPVPSPPIDTDNKNELTIMTVDECIRFCNWSIRVCSVGWSYEWNAEDEASNCYRCCKEEDYVFSTREEGKCHESDYEISEAQIKRGRVGLGDTREEM